MATTFVKIATVTVGAGGAASMDFTSIPSTYTDLVLKVSGKGTFTTGVADSAYIRFNGSSTSYSSRRLQGDGSVANSTTFTEIYFRIDNTGTGQTSIFGNAELYIPNYAGSTNKSVSSDSVEENNGTEAYTNLNAGLWSNTAAINQITLYPNNGNFAQYSTATLYGISKS